MLLVAALGRPHQNRQEPLKQPIAGKVTESRKPIRLPILYYALIALGIIIAPLVDGVSLPYASPANYAGTPQALQASMSLVAIFVMGSPVVFALSRLFLDRTQAVP